MSDDGTIERTFEIEIRARIETVWAEITRKGAPHQAMFGTYLNVELDGGASELAPGAVMMYRDKSGKYTFVMGEVLEVSQPARLVHTFRFSMQQDEPTLVVWELKESGGVTRVRVTHSRFEGETKTYKSVSTSWVSILGLYKSVIETGRAPMSSRFKNGMMMAMCFMLPAAARTENASKLSLKLK
jgi:uncharacterized protein YndB with AHSA1/START domain